MERRQVLLVDAFADEPTGGRQVAVVPDGAVSASRREAIAGELQTSGIVTHEDGELRYTDVDGSAAVVSGAVAGYAALSNRGLIVPSEHEFLVEGDAITPDGPYPVELTEDGRVSFAMPALDVTELSVDTDDVASALGVDLATLQDVGADLPAARTGAFGGTVLVPVNFLQHLSGARPDVRALASVLERAEARRLCAYTFDTLDAASDVHARVFDPRAAGTERPASGVAAGACGAHVATYGAFDGDRSEITLECGRFVDRPGTITTTVESRPQITGSALTVLDGSLSVPPEDDDDDIIQV